MSTTMPTPDAALKGFFSDNAVFADLFNSFLFNNNEVVKAEELAPDDSSFTASLRVKGKKRAKTEKLNKYRDIIRRTSIGYLVILGIEDQDKIHYSMPVRKMLYDALSYSHELSTYAKTQDKTTWTVDEYLSNAAMGTRVTPVITIVFYTGEKPWDGPRTLHDMMEIDDQISQFVPDYPLYIVDIGHDEGLSFGSEELSQLKEMLSSIYTDTGDTNYTDIHKSVIALSGILAGDIGIYKTAIDMKGDNSQVCNILKERDREIEKKVEARKEAEIAEKDAQIADYEVQLTVKDNQLAEKDAQIAELMRQIANSGKK